MDIEDRVDRIDDKLDELKDKVSGEFRNVFIELAKLEAATTDRNKLWGKGTLKLLAAVAIAVASALGINASCSNDRVDYNQIDAGVDAGDAGDGGE